MNDNLVCHCTEAIQRAPLEEWLDIASDMVEYENVDSSSNLGKVSRIPIGFVDSKSNETLEHFYF